MSGEKSSLLISAEGQYLRTPRAMRFAGGHLARVMNSDLVGALLGTSPLVRLKGIAFLGAIDYVLPRPPANYLATRLDHSIGVAYLAQVASSLLHCSIKEENLLLAAALLHDLGHGPLSHSLEPQFHARFGLNHHLRTHQLITGNDSGARKIRNVLDFFSIDVEEVIALLEGTSTHRLAYLFSSPFNLDTIEGICRSSAYVRNLRISPSRGHVVKALVSLADGTDDAETLRCLDDFWQLKGLVYTQLVRGPIGVAADLTSQTFFDRHINSFSVTDFDLTDRQLFGRFPHLHDALKAQTEQSTHSTQTAHSLVPYIRRVFWIDGSVKFERSSFPQYLTQRYKQTKVPDALLVPTTIHGGDKEWQDPQLRLDAHIATMW